MYHKNHHFTILRELDVIEKKKDTKENYHAMQTFLNAWDLHGILDNRKQLNWTY